MRTSVLAASSLPVTYEEPEREPDDKVAHRPRRLRFRIAQLRKYGKRTREEAHEQPRRHGRASGLSADPAGTVLCFHPPDFAGYPPASRCQREAQRRR